MSGSTVTPAMRQYLDAKQQHRDAILLFRMGDFYEIFYEDALVAARTLEITLTSRSKDANGGGIPMCGVPFHAVDGYITKLNSRFKTGSGQIYLTFFNKKRWSNKFDRYQNLSNRCSNLRQPKTLLLLNFSPNFHSSSRP